jgi:hypothetical protein
MFSYDLLTDEEQENFDRIVNVGLVKHIADKFGFSDVTLLEGTYNGPVPLYVCFSSNGIGWVYSLCDDDITRNAAYDDREE